MDINYFTLIAQIVNFLILVYLLKRFLYGRIIKAMDQREQKIVSRMDEAEKKKQEALAEQQSYLKIKQELADQRQEILVQAREEARKLGLELTEKARLEVADDQAKWYQAVEHQKKEFLAELRQRAAEGIFEIARRVLQDLANQELERQIILTFVQRLQNLPGGEKSLIEGFSKNGQPVRINSAFAIPDELRRKIGEVLRDQSGAIPKLDFVTSPEVVSGIELTVSGTRIAWNLADYLKELEERLATALDQKTPPAAAGAEA